MSEIEIRTSSALVIRISDGRGFRLALFLLIVLIPQWALFASSPSRQVVPFDPGWRFHLGDAVGAQQSAYDDSKWQAVGLPHSFSIPYFGSSDFYVGYGWYRKHFLMTRGMIGKHFSLEFEGVFQDAQVFVNGKEVGTHKGGYTGFAIDATTSMTEGDNLIAVRVNNLWNPRIAPRAGEHVFSGGIYRDVQLVITDSLHVAWYGTFVTTPKISAQSATINVKTEVVNSSPVSKFATIEQSVLDPEGRIVATMQDRRSVAAGESITFDQTSGSVSSPKLWHPDHPFLYSVKTELLVDGRIVDDFKSTFGMRWFKWTADQGFFLNGEHFYLKGANVHQDHAGWGDAVTNAGFERDVSLIKQAGFSFIRGSHYPHDPAFVDACDQLGVMFWSENSFWGIGGFRPDGYWDSSAYPPNPEDQPAFDASVRQELQEMIRVHRNHPSLIAWSMDNEVFFSNPELIPKVKSFLTELVSYTHQLDPTRPAAVGGVQRPLDQNRLDKLGDIAGYNGDGSTLTVFQDPGVPNLVTEYGSEAADRPGSYAPGWGDLARDHGEPVHPWRSGQAIWAGFDHGSIGGSSMGHMGLIDYFRIPKRSWYWYRDAYAHIPPPKWPEPGVPTQLKLEADKLQGIQTLGTDDVKLAVKVLDASGKQISNSPPIELTVVYGPGEFPTGSSIRFEHGTDIPISDGEASIELRSYYAGETKVRASSPGLKAAELDLSFDGPDRYIKGVTPPAIERQYVRYDRKVRPNVPQRFGKDNPTFASSALSDHVEGFAADGDRTTYWQPSSGDHSPVWTLDMERSATLSDVHVFFLEPVASRYTVEVSRDRKTWLQIADLTKNDKRERQHDFVPPPGTKATYIRLRFIGNQLGSPPKLTEVEVTGTPLVEEQTHVTSEVPK
jgi:beta-galactosidase